MLNCRQVNDKSGDYLDATLSRRERLAISLHLAMCRHCRRFVRQLQLSLRYLRRLRQDRISDEEAEQIAMDIEGRHDDRQYDEKSQDDKKDT